MKNSDSWANQDQTSFQIIGFHTDVVGQGRWKSRQLCLVLFRPDRQTTGSFFFYNPDRIRTESGQRTGSRRKIRTDRHRVVFFPKIRIESGQLTEPRQTESGQSDTRQKIRTADRHRTRFSRKSGRKRDKLRTRTVLSADVWFKLQIASSQSIPPPTGSDD